MFRAPPSETTCNVTMDRPLGLTFREKVFGLFKQRQQQPSSSLSSSVPRPSSTKESNPFSFRLNRSSKPVRARSRRGLSRFIQRGQSTRKDLPKTEEVRASSRLIEDIYHLDENHHHHHDQEDDDIYVIDEDSNSMSSDHTEPRDNRTSSRLNLGLSRSSVTRGWNRTPDSCNEMEISHTSSPSRTTTAATTTIRRTSPRSSMARSTSSIGQFGLSKQASIRHLQEPKVLIDAPHRSTPTRIQSRRSTINRTESLSSDKDSLKPPRTNGKPVHSEDRSNDDAPPRTCPRRDPSPMDMVPRLKPSPLVVVGQGSMTVVGRPASRRMVPEPLKPRFREFPMKYPSQPMLSVPEDQTLARVSATAAAVPSGPTPYLPGFSEGDYVDDERLERILTLIQLQKSEMETNVRSSSSSTHALSPTPPGVLPASNTSTQGQAPGSISIYPPGFDAKDYVEDDQLEIVLQNLQQDRDTRVQHPSSFSDRGVSHQGTSSSWQYQTYRPCSLKAVSNLSKPMVQSPLRLTFCKHESIPTIRREVYRTYSLPSISSIVRV